MPFKKPIDQLKKPAKKADDSEQKKLTPGKGIRPGAKKLEETKSQDKLSKQQVMLDNESIFQRDLTVFLIFVFFE